MGEHTQEERKNPRCHLLDWVTRIGGLRLERGRSGSREAGEEGQEAVAREGTGRLCNGKFGEELLTASFRAGSGEKRL